MYKYAQQLMYYDCVKDYLPHNWHVLVRVKTLYYQAVGNYHAALAVLDNARNVCDMFEPVTSEVRDCFIKVGSDQGQMSENEDFLLEKRKHLGIV